MAPPVDLPAWATWASVAALLLLAMLAGVSAALAKRRTGPDQDTFMGHAKDLGRRIRRILIAIVGAIILVMLVRIEAFPPYVGFDAVDNLAAQVFRRMAHDLVPAGVQLIVLRPMDGFVALFDIAVGLGILLALPYVLAQLGGFILPAMRARERHLMWRFIAPTSLLFLIGVLFAYSTVLPAGYRALYSFSAVLGAANYLDVNEFVGFTLMFLGLTGLAFQTPLVMVALARLGFATPRGYVRKWRHTLVAILLLAGLATPDPTPVSQLLVSGPLFGLYMLGIALSVPARRAYDRAQA
ncbi:MAG: twin-arginine translocase subunit TatC [bacterium]